MEIDISDFAMRAILSQTFEDRQLHPVSFTTSRPSPTKCISDIFGKEMLAVVFALKKWRYFLQGVVHKTILHSDHQNLTYFKTAVVVNRRQSRCAEELGN